MKIFHYKGLKPIKSKREPEGHSPLHSHPWEHEVFILDGEGLLVGEGRKEIR